MVRDLEMTKTGVGRVMVKDDIVRLWIDVEELTVENFMSHFSTVSRLAEEMSSGPLPVMIDLGKLRTVKRDAREFVALMLKPDFNEKIAAVYHNPAQHIVASFFFGFNKLEIPVVLVDDAEEALRWLKGDVDDVLDRSKVAEHPDSERLQVVAGQLEQMISGDFVTVPSVTSRMDEMDALSIGLAMVAEEMSALLTERDAAAAELREHRDNLELLVSERAVELLAANEQLEVEVRERRQAQEQLERANRELEGFAHTVSHDLKGPLTAITMAGEAIKALAAMPLDEQVTRSLYASAEIVTRNIKRAATLIEDLLELAEAGQAPVAVSEVDVREVIDEYLAETAVILDKRGARIIVDDDMGRLVASPVHIYQVFANLIGNGVQHNRSADALIEVRFTGRDDSGANCYVVSDNGPGILEEDLERVFFPYFKGASGATGLGLSTVDKIVKLYSGTITVRNDGGARFEFCMRDFVPAEP